MSFEIISVEFIVDNVLPLVRKRMQEARDTGIIRRSEEAEIHFVLGKDVLHYFCSIYSSLTELFKVSEVWVFYEKHEDSMGIEAKITKTENELCQRCRRHTNDVDSFFHHKEWRVCHRCNQVLLEMIEDRKLTITKDAA